MGFVEESPLKSLRVHLQPDKPQVSISPCGSAVGAPAMLLVHFAHS
jgi:hypothetical protein